MTVYFFGPGREGCHDCAADENGKPLCTMNCGPGIVEVTGQDLPEPCLTGRCWSPLSCKGWGYCRHRNYVEVTPPQNIQKHYRDCAAFRKKDQTAIGAHPGQER